MPPEKDDKIAELLRPMLRKRLFVALSKAVARPEGSSRIVIVLDYCSSARFGFSHPGAREAENDNEDENESDLRI
jgi:hypothetical protein